MFVRTPPLAGIPLQTNQRSTWSILHIRTTIFQGKVWIRVSNELPSSLPEALPETLTTMGFIDSLRPSRVVRFAEDPEDESKTAFLNGNGKMSTTSAKPDAVMTASRSLYWTLYAFMFTTILLLSIIIFQGHGNSIIGPTEYWSQDVLGKGIALAVLQSISCGCVLTVRRKRHGTSVHKGIQPQRERHPRD